MACADALWKMYIEPKELRTDPHGLYQHACRIHPHDSGKIGSKPGFRLVHDFVHQSATARMLDIWRIAAKESGSHDSLSSYGASSPEWDDIVALSHRLVDRYLDKPQHPDPVFRNNSIVLARLLLYVELAHSMKHGDIGRVENTFLHWVFIFKAVGKHKYATALVKVMNDLKYTYPQGLAYVFPI